MAELRHGRRLREKARAPLTGHGDGFQALVRHMRGDVGNLRKAEECVAREQIGTLWPGTAIGDVREIEPEALGELESKEVRGGAHTVRGVAELARITLDPRYQLVEALGWNARMRRQDEWDLDTLE